MPLMRNRHTAALLLAVLAAWGCGNTTFNSGAGSTAGTFQVVPTPPVHRDRAFHTATTLVNGDVLIAGGVDGSGGRVGDAERFRLLGSQFLVSGFMLVPRSKHTATLLTDGTVLVAGGADGPTGLTAQGEIYRPATNDWAAAPGNPLAQARQFHRAAHVAKPQDSVLILGGEDNATVGPLATVERFVPGTGFQPTANPLRTARTMHTANVIDDGRVLVIGGFGGGAVLASVEFYDPATETSVFAKNGLNHARQDHAAIVLADGRVLVLGGTDAQGAALDIAEVYDWRTDTSFNVPAPMTIPRASPTASLLVDGRVLITGNGATAEIYDPHRSTFTATTGNLAQPRVRHTSTLVSSAETLIFGGSSASAPAEFFEDR